MAFLPIRFNCERCGRGIEHEGPTCHECYTDTLYRNIRSRAMRAIFGPEWVRARMSELRYAVALKGGAK